MDSRHQRLSADWVEHIFFISLAIIVLIFFIVAFRSVYASEYHVEFIEYTVRGGDTLFEIVSKVNEDYEGPYDIRDLLVILRDKNNLNTDLIHPGQELWIPKVMSSH